MEQFTDCKFFVENRCTNGLHCKFRHNEKASNTSQTCPIWSVGRVCDGRCNLRHPTARELMQLRVNAHSTPPRMDADEEMAATVLPPRRFAVTPTFDAKGPVSRSQVATMHLHPRDTTTPVCRFFVQGRCAKGAKCPFPHPPSRGGHITPTGNAASLRAAAIAAREHRASRADVALLGGTSKGPGSENEASGEKDLEAEERAKVLAEKILRKHRVSLSAAPSRTRGAVVAGGGEEGHRNGNETQDQGLTSTIGGKEVGVGLGVGVGVKRLRPGDDVASWAEGGGDAQEAGPQGSPAALKVVKNSPGRSADRHLGQQGVKGSRPQKAPREAGALTDGEGGGELGT